jgi:hypothetical protein
MMRIPALPLVLLLAAGAAPALGHCEPQNRTGIKSPRTACSHRAQPLQNPEKHGENALPNWYDAAGVSFTEKERNDGLATS